MFVLSLTTCNEGGGTDARDLYNRLQCHIHDCVIDYNEREGEDMRLVVIN